MRRIPLVASGLLLLACSACSGAPSADTGDAAPAPTPGPTASANEDAGTPAAGDDGGSGIVLGGDSGSSTTDDGAAGSSRGDAASKGDASPSAPSVRVVAYLPNYSGSYADWAKTIDFTNMTHLNLAFATADSSNAWDMGASDSDVETLVTAAHAAGTKVLASLGGGGGDQTVIAQYKDSANLAPLIANLDALVARLDLDGADIDIEDASNLGAGYTGFVNAVVADLRPKGKLVTAAVAQYLQDSMSDDTLHQFDFLNVMIYSTYADSVSAMTYYSGTKSVPVDKLTLGAGFFASDASGNNEYAYSAVLAADSTAWSKDQTTYNGETVTYTGVASMQKLTQYSMGFGGIMFWELSEDATGEHSLYKAIQSAL